MESKIVQLSTKKQYKEGTSKAGKKTEYCKEPGGFRMQSRGGTDRSDT